jgi:hypothetical protein
MMLFAVEVAMVSFIKSLLSAGMLVGLGLAVGCSGSDTGTSGQTKKDASGMQMMKQKQDEMAKKRGQSGAAAADDADKDKDKADDKNDDKKADDKPKADKKDK